MRKKLFIVFLCFIIVFCTACNKNIHTKKGEMRTITDMAGRTVSVPMEINKIYATGQPGVVMLYTTAPECLMGWCLALTEEEAQLIEPKYLSLPVLGLMQGSNDTVNREEILERAPDVLLTVITQDEGSIRNADDLQNFLGIPVVVCDIAMEKLPECYKLVGELTGNEKRAEELSAYCEKIIEEAQKTVLSIPKDEKKTVYYAQGSSGLQTVSKGSPHSEVIDLIGALNVVKLNGDNDGQLSVDMEQVLSYNPEVIIASYSMGHTDKTGNEIFNELSRGQQAWRDIKAVQNNQVYSTPCLPYNFLDIPPSANRMIGISWLGNLLYPQYFNFDIEQRIKDFYKLFYRIDLSEEQYEKLMLGALKNN